MNLQELQEILEQNKVKARFFAGEIEKALKRQREILKDKPGKLAYHKLMNCTEEEREKYHSWRPIVKKLQKKENKQDLVIKYIESYIKNYKHLLAYNFYITELQALPKLNNKPIHYKIVQNALAKIYDKMPQEFKMRHYEINFLCNHRYHRYEDFLQNGALVLDDLKVIDFTPTSPEIIVQCALEKYEKTYAIICNAQKEINDLWQGFLPPLGTFTELQYDNSTSPTHILFNTDRVCPNYLFYK